ncbi:hypothetical protein [Kibdelosporangium philippinense]
MAGAVGGQGRLAVGGIAGSLLPRGWVELGVSEGGGALVSGMVG